jgi:hypothetical protein
MLLHGVPIYRYITYMFPGHIRCIEYSRSKDPSCTLRLQAFTTRACRITWHWTGMLPGYAWETAGGCVVMRMIVKCLGTCITILVITFCEFADRLWSTISARMFFVVLGRHGHVPFGKVRGMISSALHTADGKAHGTRHMLELHCFYPPTCHSINQYSDLWLCDTL